MGVQVRLRELDRRAGVARRSSDAAPNALHVLYGAIGLITVSVLLSLTVDPPAGAPFAGAAVGLLGNLARHLRRQEAAGRQGPPPVPGADDSAA